MGTQKSVQENQRLRLDRDYLTRSGRGLRRPSLAWPSLSYLLSSIQMHSRHHSEHQSRGLRPEACMPTISPNHSTKPSLSIRPFFRATSPLVSTSSLRLSVAHL